MGLQQPPCPDEASTLPWWRACPSVEKAPRLAALRSVLGAAGENPHQRLRSRNLKRQRLRPTWRSDLHAPPETSEAQPSMPSSSWARRPLLSPLGSPPDPSLPLTPPPPSPRSAGPSPVRELISLLCLGVSLTHLE